MPQCPKLGNDTTRVSPDAQHMFEHDARVPRRLQRLRQDHVVEGIVGVVRQVGVGVTLDHRKSLRDALVDALTRQFDAAPVDAARLGQQTQQFAVATADVQHLGAGRDHLGDHEQVDAGAARRAGRLRHGEVLLEAHQHGRSRAGARPRALAAPSRKPLTIANSSGSSSKNAS